MIPGNLAAIAAEASAAAPLSVLAVDDDPTQRMLVGAALEGKIEVVEAENGLAAVQALERRRFDLVILDLDMPVMDGFGVIERARAAPETRHLPIIVVTSRDDVVAIERAFALGATSFLCKPINWNIFRHQVGFVLKVAEGERELRDAKRRSDRLAEFGARGIAALEADIGRAAEAMGEAGEGAAGIGEVAAAAARLHSGLRRVGQASEILSGKVQFSPQAFDANEIASGALRAVRSALGSEASSVIEMAPADRMPIWCDKVLAELALAEVLKNAVKATGPAGKVRLGIVAAPADRVRFEVADDGPGIPEHVLEAAAEDFLPSGGPASAYSRGFGLPIAKATVDRHGGHFGIMSEPAQGTEAFLSFPTRPA